MAQVIAPEMCQNMVVWWYEQWKTVLDISKLACCSQRTIYEVLQLHQGYSQVVNPLYLITCALCYKQILLSIWMSHRKIS
jgi:hypothetical protein